MPNSLELLGCFCIFGVRHSPVCQIHTVFLSSCPSLVRVLDLKPRFPSLLSGERSASPFAVHVLTLETPSDGEGPALLPALCLRHALFFSLTPSPFGWSVHCSSVLLERDVRQQGTALSQL